MTTSHPHNAARSTREGARAVQPTAHQTSSHQATDKAAEYLAGWQRAKADYDNLRRRTEEQRGVLIKTATEELVRSLLPVMDSFELAMAQGKDSASLKKGVELIHAQLRDVLATQGLEVIRAADKPFDPALHEAVAHVPGDKNICVNEHAPGYKLHGKVLRPARVSVGNGALIKS